MMLMDKLDAAAKNGASVDVYWYYDKEDDTMQELGEEFGEDLAERQVPSRENARLMSSDDLFAAEEQVIAAAQKLLDDGPLWPTPPTASSSSSCSRTIRSCSAPRAG